MRIFERNNTIIDICNDHSNTETGLEDCNQICYKDPVIKDHQWSSYIDRSPGAASYSEVVSVLIQSLLLVMLLVTLLQYKLMFQLCSSSDVLFKCFFFTFSQFS